MEKSLERLLNQWGMHFNQIGYAQQYYRGLCSVYLAKVQEIEDCVLLNESELLDITSHPIYERVRDPLINFPCLVEPSNIS